MKILYVGEIHTGSTCKMRMIALQELGHELFTINTHPGHNLSGPRSLAPRVLNKLGYPLDRTGANRQILGKIAESNFDVVWLDKAVTIWPGTLKQVKKLQPRAVIAGYSPDDMAARHCHSQYFLKGLNLYDIYFTTKTFGVKELEAMGAPVVCFSGNAFDSHTHRPIQISAEQKTQFGGGVGFIGDYELDRAQQMLHLAQNGIPVRIWGPNWNKSTFNHPNLLLEKKALWGEDYATAICAFDINLGFLRKCNRDLQTQRSIEIPACAAFMLAERTIEHAGLFEEGKEAAYFDSTDELLQKVRYYLEHSQERERISQAGRARCLSSGYSYSDRLRQCLLEIETQVSK